MADTKTSTPTAALKSSSNPPRETPLPPKPASSKPLSSRPAPRYSRREVVLRLIWYFETH
jgi:hypothetical protein